MKAASLVAAALIVVFANTFALMHAARNRSGSPEAEVMLTQRELRYALRSPSDEDSGVTLNLQWTGPGSFGLPAADYANWLDAQKLGKLGFDCSVNPADAEAARFYERQRPRRAFVALEYYGPAWQAWLEAWQRSPQFNNLTDQGRLNSRLVAIDADLDAGQLRARNPDRTKVLILPGVVAIRLDNYTYKSDPARAAAVRGSIQDLPSSIHIPVPFSNAFHGFPNTAVEGLSYQVHLRYGSEFEPIVTGVDFTK
jgi:hypothetical protein